MNKIYFIFIELYQESLQTFRSIEREKEWKEEREMGKNE